MSKDVSHIKHMYMYMYGWIYSEFYNRQSETEFKRAKNISIPLMPSNDGISLYRLHKELWKSWTVSGLLVNYGPLVHFGAPTLVTVRLLLFRQVRIPHIHTYILKVEERLLNECQLQGKVCIYMAEPKK